MRGRANQPRDLVWSLEDFSSPDNAMKFFNAFQNSFMIYSTSVSKLYCEYSTHITGPSGHQRMVVLPDFTQFEAIFNHIDDSAIEETSIHIYPKMIKGKIQLILSGHSKIDGSLEKMPIRQGLKSLKMGYFQEGAISPVLMLGDLREFPAKKLPYLKLHMVKPNRLTNASEFERKDVMKGSWSKLDNLF